MRDTAPDRGFTLVEVTLAILILAVGLLALVGAGAAVTRMIADGRQLQRAGLFAQEVVESLHGRPCGGIRTGTADRDAQGASWSVTGEGNARHVVVTVKSRAGLRTRVHVIEALIPCRP